jgi:hypothetical protein
MSFGPKESYFWPSHVIVFQECQAKGSGRPALNVDIAPVISNSPDYKQKFTIQLSLDELALFALLLKKHKAESKFEYHGSNKDKALYTKWYPKTDSLGFFFYQKGISRGAAYIKFNELFRVFRLVISMLARAYNETNDGIYAMLEQFYGHTGHC